MVRCGRERDLCSCGDGVCGAGCGGVGGKFGGETMARKWATALTLLQKASIDGAATMVAGSAFHEIMVLGRKE